MKRSHVVVTLLVIWGTTSSASAQSQRNRGTARTVNTAGLLRSEAIRNELDMTDEQEKTLQEKLQAARVSREDLANLSPEERRKRVIETVKKSDEAIQTVLDEKQQKRLGELQLQMAGAIVLMDPKVAQQLNLEQEQKEKLRAIARENRPEERFDFRNASAEERQKYLAESQKRREKTEKAFLAVLTPEQKETFDKMKGEKFDFSKLRERRRNRDQ